MGGIPLFSADEQADQQTNTDMMKVVVTFCNCVYVAKTVNIQKGTITLSLVQFSYKWNDYNIKLTIMWKFIVANQISTLWYGMNIHIILVLKLATALASLTKSTLV